MCARGGDWLRTYDCGATECLPIRNCDCTRHSVDESRDFRQSGAPVLGIHRQKVRFWRLCHSSPIRERPNLTPDTIRTRKGPKDAHDGHSRTRLEVSPTPPRGPHLLHRGSARHDRTGRSSAAGAATRRRVYVTHVTTTSATLRWSAPRKARSFRMQYSTSRTMKHAKYKRFNARSGRVAHLKPNHRYYFRVRVSGATAAVATTAPRASPGRSRVSSPASRTCRSRPCRCRRLP